MLEKFWSPISNADLREVGRLGEGGGGGEV